MKSNHINNGTKLTLIPKKPAIKDLFSLIKKNSLYNIIESLSKDTLMKIVNIPIPLIFYLQIKILINKNLTQ